MFGNGACRPIPQQHIRDMRPYFQRGSSGSTKRYYISVLRANAADPFYGANATGHGWVASPIPVACKPVAPAKDLHWYPGMAPVTVISEPSPYPPAKLSVFVFEDDFPLNGEHDAGGPMLGGALNTPAANEQGLGGFQIHLWDAFGGAGDFTGQMGFDMFNEPLSNSLAGTIDPGTGWMPARFQRIR